MTEPISEFVIRCSKSDSVLRFRSSAQVDPAADERVEFIVELRGTPVSATVEVYDAFPHHWSAYFQDLALNWRGWEGSKGDDSLEGHLKISATLDRLGHVALAVSLGDDPWRSTWRVRRTLCLEAGQLESISRDAAAFFG